MNIVQYNNSHPGHTNQIKLMSPSLSLRLHYGHYGAESLLTCWVLCCILVSGKRARQEQGLGAATEPQNKRFKDRRSEEQEESSGPTQPHRYKSLLSRSLQSFIGIHRQQERALI